MAERSALGLAGVMEDGSGGAGRGVVAGESEALQREHAKMIFHQRNGIVGGEDPVVERSLAPAGEGRKLGGGHARSDRRGGRGSHGSKDGLRGRGLEERQRCGVEQLARAQGLQLVGDPAVGIGTAEFGGAEFAGREIERGEAEVRSCCAWRATAQRKLFSSEPSWESAAVPGVTIRVTSRRTSFLVSLGSST